MSDGKLFLTCQACGMLVGCNNVQSCEDCSPEDTLRCVTRYDEEGSGNRYVAIITKSCKFCPAEDLADSEVPAMLSS